jgi:hypothetical protein
VGLMRLVRAVLVVTVVVLASIWLFDAARQLVSGIGFFLALAVIGLLLVDRRHRPPRAG